MIFQLSLQTASAFAPQHSNNIYSSRAASAAVQTPTSLSAMPICIVVEAEIKEDKMDEFLDMIEKNAVGSRAEPGCLRFGKLFLYCNIFPLSYALIDAVISRHLCTSPLTNT